jgi:DNA-binding NarL/FixJ family response regulator
MSKHRAPKTEPAPTFSVGGARYFVHSYPLEDSLSVALSECESKVLELLLRGMSNAEIAKARGTSVHTIGNQVSSILRKVGVGSRYELVARASRAS